MIFVYIYLIIGLMSGCAFLGFMHDVPSNFIARLATLVVFDLFWIVLNPYLCGVIVSTILERIKS